MKRLASLDLLRGIAAIAVAAPHYVMLGSTDWPAAHVISILAVEVFFVLSGFVLAQQLLFCLETPRMADLGVFLARRWMRTIPPFLAALLIYAAISGNLYGPVIWQYAFYVQNLWKPLAEAQDFFAIAWSLSVEEWFYIVIALLVAAGRLAGLRQKQFIFLTIGFVAAIAILRWMAGDMAHWDSHVRRITLFRLDAIAFGFLLWCAREKVETFFARNTKFVTVGLLCLSGALACYAGWQASAEGSALWRHLYPYTSALFAAFAIAALYAGSAGFDVWPLLTRVGLFLGKISYTIYLHHLTAVLLLRPLLQGLPLPLQISIYLALLCLFCAAFFAFFEAPILAARPKYQRGDGATSTAAPLRAAFAQMITKVRTMPRGKLATGAALVAVLTLAVVLLERFQEDGREIPFKITLILIPILAIALLQLVNAWRQGLLRALALTGLFFALLLPVADLLFERTRTGQALAPAWPVYSFREADGNPDAFRSWWARYRAEWLNSGINMELSDPGKFFPFLLKPGFRGSFFDAPLRINNLGFRGADIDPAKGDRYRIFALGESPTFGTMIRKEDVSWVEALQGLVDSRLVCRRPVEIINAGTASYNLVHNIERLKQSVLPLSPDMVISYHGYNGLSLVDPELGKLPVPPSYKFRGSLLLSEVRFRLRTMRYAHEMKRRFPTAANVRFSDEYEKLYGKLADLSREHKFRLVLANLSLAVNSQSPADVINFYGRVFQPVSRILPAIAEHNRIVEDFARRSSQRFVDTRPGIDGEWDRDYFIDIVHFTDKGARVFASRMFDALLPDLRSASGPECRDK